MVFFDHYFQTDYHITTWSWVGVMRRHGATAWVLQLFSHNFFKKSCKFGLVCYNAHPQCLWLMATLTKIIVRCYR